MLLSKLIMIASDNHEQNIVKHNVEFQFNAPPPPLTWKSMIVCNGLLESMITWNILNAC